MIMPLGKKIRHEFPIFKNNERILFNKVFPFVYLDSAVSAQKPQCVIDAVCQHMEKNYGSIHRGAYSVSVSSSQMYEDTRQQVAQFLGFSVSKQNIIYTKGTTEAINLLAYGIAQEYLDDKSRIVIPMCEHHANLVPWQQAALRSNCELAYIPLIGKQTTGLQLNLQVAKKIITKNTKVVSLAYVGNILGQINPIAEIIEMSKSVGALVIIDAAQSVSSFEDDLFAMGVDAIAFSGHKMYAPSGIGILAMKEELINRLPPFLYGGAMVSSVSLEESHWASGPSKFEGGTPPISEVAGLSAAITWINQQGGRHNIHKHASQLASQFIEGLFKIPNIEIYAPNTGAETIVSFRHQKIHAHDFATILDNSNVAMRAGHHCAWPLIQFLGIDALVRASFAAYSDSDDVEISLEAIKSASKYL